MTYRASGGPLVEVRGEATSRVRKQAFAGPRLSVGCSLCVAGSRAAPNGVASVRKAP